MIKHYKLQKLLFILLVSLPFFGQSQVVGYSVTVTQLMALADDCDGGAPFCVLAPQDPVFKIWVSDAGANENYYCWTFDNDDDQDYGLWNDIPNVEVANVTIVTSSYISFEMEGFESDAISTSCTTESGDDAVIARTFVEQIDLIDIPTNTPTLDTLSLGGIYFMEIEIEWFDYANVDELSNELAVTLAPNPSNGIVNLSINEPGVSNYTVLVVDLSGKVILQQENDTKIDLSAQESGAYFVKVVTENKSITKRILLQK